MQRHREVPGKLRAAVDDIIRVHKEASNPGGLAAALHLGDIIDGYANDPDEEARSAHDLDAVLAELQRLEAAGVPMRHVFGNHCFALPRAVLLQRLGFPEGSSGYYSVELGPGWRLVVLDTTDLSLYGHQQVRGGCQQSSKWVCMQATCVLLVGHSGAAGCDRVRGQLGHAPDVPARKGATNTPGFALLPQSTPLAVWD